MNNWKQNSGYSADDIMAMQKDAIARVKEMQRRADQTLHRNQQPSPTGAVEPQTVSPPPEKENKNMPSSASPAQKPAPRQQSTEPSHSGHPSVMGNVFSMVDNLLTASPSTGKLQVILNALNVDNERLLILILLVMLYNDGADYTVLLALLYLLI